MIRVELGTDPGRKEILVPTTTTVGKVLEELNIDYNSDRIFLRGREIKPEDLSKTFVDLNIYVTALITTPDKPFPQ